VLGDPAGGPFAELDAKAAKSFLLAARRERVVKLAGRSVKNKEGPEVGLDDALHVFELSLIHI